MRISWLYIVFLFQMLFALTSFNVVAQKLTDTIELSEVQVSGQNIERFQAGAKIEKINPISIKQLQDGNLSDLLIRFAQVSIKTDAGGLSTIRIRGTSPNHSTVNFGEIDLNSLTLGSSNLVNIPLYLFDEISLQYGSSATVNGTGNIGGAIYLSLQNQWVNGFKGEIRLANGSFGEQLYGTKLYFGNGKWESVSRIYYYHKTNDFRFYNTAVKNFSTGIIGVEDRQHNAAINNKGILQEINHQFSPGKTFKLNLWLENNWHNIQQNQATNYYNPGQKETYEEKHARVLANYDNLTNKLKTHIGLAWSLDNGIYNGTSNAIKTKNFIGDAFIEHDVNSHISYKTGTKLSRIYPTVYAYDSMLVVEDRADFYFLYNHLILKKLRVTINLRQGFVTKYKIPFVPALGLTYTLFYKENQLMKISGNLAKSYRVPSFNDRFWVPGGNPNLLPENGMNYDFGAEYEYHKTGFNSNTKLNAFFIDVDNWILWRYGGSYWYADNVQRVQSKGIELINELHCHIGKLELVNYFHYSFTYAERVESATVSSAIGRQLEYIPVHAAMFNLTSISRQFNFSIDGEYTNKRYTDETNGNILPQLFLLNAAAGYDFKINKENNLNIKLLINNILNKNYQSSIDYPMPRINYRISLTYSYN